MLAQQPREQPERLLAHLGRKAPPRRSLRLGMKQSQLIERS
jgi:hypothetical protein